MMQVHGRVTPRFDGVKEAFLLNFTEGKERGASFCATIDGEPVVDIWAGTADDRDRPWQEDTIVNVYSTTKTMAAISLLLLADRREVDLDAPAAHYWPEFAANGKKEVRVKHFLSHSAGLSGFDVPATTEDLYDWEKMTARLAAQAPWWEPGTKSGYHALTQGYLIGEIVRRVTGQTIGRFFREEIAEPLGADFHIGLDKKHFDRVADLVPPADPRILSSVDPDSIAARSFRGAPQTVAATRTAAWRQAEIPAGNGHGNARSIARVQSLVACGGAVNGKRILSEAGVGRVFEEQTFGVDLVLGFPIRFGLGYGLKSERMPLGPNPRTCFWAGYGGSLVIIDADARMCLAYAMNRMSSATTGDMRAARLVMAFFGALAQAR
jgi:CubicO group peptidase (beta-lactamase class C family)